MENDANKSRTPSAEAFTKLVLEIFQFHGRLLASGDQLSKELGLSSALWQVLGAISQGPLPVAQIARNMGLTRQSVQRTANVLKNKGFVEFHDNPDHKRAKLVLLTKQGVTVLEKVSRLQVAWANRIAKGLDKKEIISATRTIKKIHSRL